MISTGYSVNRRGTRLTSLSVRNVPDRLEGRDRLQQPQPRVPVPQQGLQPSPALAEPARQFKNRRLRSKVVVTVKVTGPTGAVKVMTLRMRANRLPVRTYRCAAPGAKLGKC